MPVFPSWECERRFWQMGYALVAGIDEAGRGAWAGPVTVAAVILPPEERRWPFRDSKQLTAAQRRRLAHEVREVAVAYAVAHAWPKEVDALNVLGATHAAAARALATLNPPPQALITDYLRLNIPLPLVAPVRADALSYSVAAASLLAKTARDEVMTELDARFSGYGFARHKGYGVSSHREALLRLGPCEMHRQSVKPVANCQRRSTGLQLPLLAE